MKTKAANLQETSNTMRVNAHDQESYSRLLVIMCIHVNRWHGFQCAFYTTVKYRKS